MAITLAQAKLTNQDKLFGQIVDEFRKGSLVMDNIPFDNCVSSTGLGQTMTYAYNRITTQPTAAFRAINSEYIPQETQVAKYSTDLKVFGGSFQIDRVIADMGGIVNLVDFQIQQKVKAAVALFLDTMINGDTGSNANAFDGLDKAITGSSTEYNAAATPVTIDLSTSANIDTYYKIIADEMDIFLSNLDGKPSFIAGNSLMIAKLRAVANRLGYFTQSEDAFGRKISSYDGVPLVDLGDKPGTANPIIPISAQGYTSLYAVKLGLDGFHAVSPSGQMPVKYYLPDVKTSGAVKTGEVEMVAATVLKATKAAGVFRNIKVK